MYTFNPSLQFINSKFKGNIKIDNIFQYEDGIEKIPYHKILQALRNPSGFLNKDRKDKWVPKVHINSNFLFTDEDCIVWLGHSSFFIRLDGVNILTDPVFYDISILLKRRHPLPCEPNMFSNIDLILLSHGHRDHLDIKSLKVLERLNKNIHVYCPLGHVDLLQSIGFKNVVEAAWYQQFNHPKLDIVMCPAKHWNRRGLLDYNRTLWGSFMIKSKNKKVFFAGDTAYSNHFLEIRNELFAPDICMMPVGAYQPEFMMSWAHQSPLEAVQAFNDMEGNYFIPMHYGTFNLSMEPPSEPLQLLKQSDDADKMILPDVGQTIVLDLLLH
jgi:L-ascorbate metabolism protein UlaG (beta-lactamase superfamily)